MERTELERIHGAERRKWDALAPAEVTEDHLAADAVTFAEAARRSVKLPGVADFLGDLAGKQVLEYGCGMGHYTVLLAKTGAQVTTFDISTGSLEFTRRRLAAQGLGGQVESTTAEAENLPFDEGRFDVVFGTAILHHIDPVLGPPELHRVLKEGGRAAFTEPLGMNPILNFVRDHVPYPAKTPRGDDVPLLASHLRAWTDGYREVDIRGVHLLSMVERGFGFGKELPRLRAIDEVLLRRYPSLVKLCRYAAIMLTK
jgi:SAM-dependent methyltransferase